MALAKAQLVQQLNDARQENKEMRQELQELRQLDAKLQGELTAAKTGRTKERADYERWKNSTTQHVKEGIDKLKRERLEEVARLKEEHLQTTTEQGAASQKLEEELTVTRVSYDHLQIIRDRISNISSLDGKLWNRAPSPSAPTFRRRKTPIISVLNLKGGVGKTTITANLGATLAERRKKVLMIDLDFQRSLSRLLLSTNERKIRHLDRHCLQHFLSGKTHDAKTLLEMVGEPIADLTNCSFLPNSDSIRDNSPDTSGCEDDSLEETEMRLMIDWIFERDPRDIRFHLREALHDPRIEDCFDYILLDCPPRLTTACINALAASDFVLVPVTLDAMATNSVPYLLKSLDFLKKDILPELDILGVVANRVKMRAGSPERTHGRAWETLTQQFEGRKPRLWFFSTMIQENSAIGRFATQAIEEDELALRLAISDEKTKVNFEELVDEIEKKLAHDGTQAPPPAQTLASSEIATTLGTLDGH